MSNPATPVVAPTVAAIACGGTGGHFFPGLAVGQELQKRGCAVTLLISEKDIDRQAAEAAVGMNVVSLPAVGWSAGGAPGFVRGFWKSYRLAKQHFQRQMPQFVLGMGGFTAAPPLLAGRRLGAQTFLHESNSIPGRANRWLARWVDGAFVYFESAGERLRARRVAPVGMPVRPEFLQLTPAAAARGALGLNPNAPVLLIMGGSQGARMINMLITGIVPQLLEVIPDLQFIHLTGAEDLPRVEAAYAACRARALVRPFLAEMGMALAAANAAVSRAGASSLAELAACRLPAVLIPYPTAADNHQYYNARAFARSGAACLLEQKSMTPVRLTQEILALLADPLRRAAMQQALRGWHSPEAAAEIADRMLHWNARRQVAPAVAADPNAAKLGVLNA